MMRLLAGFFVGGVLLVGLGGCSTAPATGSPTVDARHAVMTRGERDRLLGKVRKGMTATEVRALLGEPVKVAPMEAPAGASPGAAEVWTYVFKFEGGVRQVQTGETTYTRQNPLTGVMETLSEPVYSVEHIVVEQKIEFLMYQGSLTEWKTSQELSHVFDN